MACFLTGDKIIGCMYGSCTGLASKCIYSPGRPWHFWHLGLCLLPGVHGWNPSLSVRCAPLLIGLLVITKSVYERREKKGGGGEGVMIWSMYYFSSRTRQVVYRLGGGEGGLVVVVAAPVNQICPLLKASTEIHSPAGIQDQTQYHHMCIS